MPIKELQAKKAKAIADAQAILNKATSESRSMTAEEDKSYNTAFDEAQSLKDTVEKAIVLQAQEREMATAVADLPVASDTKNVMTAENAYGRILAFGPKSDQAIEAVKVYNALQKDIDTAGGYTVPPEEFVARLIKKVDDMTFIRAKATKLPVTSSESLGIPSLDNDPADADWTTELATGSEDSTMDFGKRNLKPTPIAKRIKVSKSLLQRSALPVENLVIDRLAYKFGITEEKAFLTGTGALQPLGLFTASADGIPTSRDVAADNTATSISANGLRNAKYFLKGNYWANAEWLFHRDAVKQISKLKDGNGQYLWQPGLRAGDPDTLLGFGINMSEYAPNAFSTGNYVGMLGDFSHYYIADALNMTIETLRELYAETNQIGFIGRMELDGMPVLGEPFVRVTLA